MTYRLESSCLLGPGGGIIDGDAALSAVHALVGHGLDALVGAVPGLEVDGGRPVVGQVLVELAAGAAGEVCDVGDRHGGVECVLGTLSARSGLGLFTSFLG